ncbi:MAG: hypothetical protein DWQ02_12135 [Bacteroidetes bacterium]|nr:MAG: hypothetical protein DWQ02_12135 [Bacteroidota bacterium]
MTEEEHIQKGFNTGYRLQQLDPTLSQKFIQTFEGNSHPYVQGFVKGTEQLNLEREQAKANSQTEDYFNQIQSRLKPRSPEKGRDKDDKGIDL